MNALQSTEEDPMTDMTPVETGAPTDKRATHSRSITEAERDLILEALGEHRAGLDEALEGDALKGTARNAVTQQANRVSELIEEVRGAKRISLVNDQ